MFPGTPIPPLNLSTGPAISSANPITHMAPLNFGSYNQSPVTGSGNETGTTGPAGLPVWVWLAVAGGAYLLAKGGKK